MKSAGRRQEIRAGPRHRAGPRRVALRAAPPAKGRLSPGGDAQLPFDEIEAGHHFGHRMLDLQAGIHLDEPDGRPRAARRHRRRIRPCRRRHSQPPGPGDRPPAEFRAQRRIHPRRRDSSTTFWLRRWSEQSRSPRCSTLPWPSAKTCTSICRALATNFSTSAAVIAEGGGLTLRPGQGGGEGRFGFHPAHPAAAATGDRLDHHREADPGGFLGQPLGRLVSPS